VIFKFAPVRFHQFSAIFEKTQPIFVTLMLAQWHERVLPCCTMLFHLAFVPVSSPLELESSFAGSIW
jgi:hypothetical protein